MDNLHFIPNNIFTKFFKELTKKKKKMTINNIYIYIQELYYAFYCISLSICMYMHEVASNIV